MTAHKYFVTNAHFGAVTKAQTVVYMKAHTGILNICEQYVYRSEHFCDTCTPTIDPESGIWNVCHAGSARFECFVIFSVTQISK